MNSIDQVSFFLQGSFVMNDRDVDRQSKPRKKLVLNKETVRVLTDREQMAIEGGFMRACTNGLSTCSPGGNTGGVTVTCKPALTLVGCY